MTTFQKPPLLIPQQLDILHSRGLSIPDPIRAERYLETIGYYRLSAYFLPFYSCKDRFRENTNFDNILDLYIFDRKLRILSMDPIQRIEIAIRSAIANSMASKYGAFWYTKRDLFEDNTHYEIFINHVRKRTIDSRHKPQFLKHYYEKYSSPELPPIWMLAEVLSMGCWSKIYANLKNKQDKREIASKFDFSWRHFESWLKYTTILRNTIAHHMRLWNMQLPFIPAKIERYANNCGATNGSYLSFVVIMTLLRRFTHRPSWHRHLKQHLETCPLDIHKHMKFPIGWEELPFWL